MTTTAAPPRPRPGSASPLGDHVLKAIDAYRRAANYLAVGQICLMDIPLLTGPLLPAHVRPPLLRRV